METDSRFSRRYDWAEVRKYYEDGHSMRECQIAFGERPPERPRRRRSADDRKTVVTSGG
jgi:hypothetical protein